MLRLIERRMNCQKMSSQCGCWVACWQGWGRALSSRAESEMQDGDSAEGGRSAGLLTKDREEGGL